MLVSVYSYTFCWYVNVENQGRALHARSTRRPLQLIQKTNPNAANLKDTATHYLLEVPLKDANGNSIGDIMGALALDGSAALIDNKVPTILEATVQK